MPMFVVVVLVALGLGAESARAAEGPYRYLDRAGQLSAPTSYPPPIPTLTPFSDGARVLWMPEGWALHRLAAGAYEAKGPAQAVVQIVVNDPGAKPERWLARICKRPKKRDEIHTAVESLVCSDGAVARRLTQKRAIPVPGSLSDWVPVVTVTGVMIDAELVSRLAAVNAVSLEPAAAAGSPRVMAADAINELRAPADVVLPGLGWQVVLPADPREGKSGSHYAITRWDEAGSRAWVIARRNAYEIRDVLQVESAAAVVALTAASTPCPASIPRSDRESWSDLGYLLDPPYEDAVTVVAPSVFTGSKLSLELCLPIAPGSVWVGVSLLGRQAGEVSSYVQNSVALVPLLHAVLRGAVAGAAADVLDKRASTLHGTAPDRPARLVEVDRFNELVESPAERARAAERKRAPPKRAASQPNCRALIAQMARFDGPGYPHACSGTRDEQLAFAEAWYARRAAEGWPGIYSFGSHRARIADPAPLGRELALIDAMITLAQAGGTADAAALRAYGEALERLGVDELAERGRALSEPRPPSAPAHAPSDGVEAINRSVDAYFESLSRVGKGCIGVAACAEQARRDALDALNRRR